MLIGLVGDFFLCVLDFGRFGELMFDICLKNLVMRSYGCGFVVVGKRERDKIRWAWGLFLLMGIWELVVFYGLDVG